VEKLDHILTQNLTTLDEVIEVVQNVRDGYLILSNFNSTTGKWSQQRQQVWLQEVKDICDYTVAVAAKFIERRERQRSVWHLFYPYQQHFMEMNLMKQMEHISTQFGDALYRRWRESSDGRHYRIRNKTSYIYMFPFVCVIVEVYEPQFEHNPKIFSSEESVFQRY